MNNATTGLWEPHSSSVDFCEPNYLVSPYIAEVHNVWSSLYMVLLAVVGMRYGNVTNEWRHVAMFMVLFVVGWGSAGLHGTLHWLFQSADEVPMLWGNIAYFFCLYNLHTPVGKSTSKMALTLLIVGSLQTYVYYVYQKMYWVFIVCYVTGVSIVVAWSAYLVVSCRKDSEDYAIRWWLFSRAIFSFVVIAGGLWIYEMHNCDTLQPHFSSWYGLSFHILWHVGAGLGNYLVITLLVAVRCQALGGVVELEWLCGGLVPVLRRTARKSIHYE